MKRAKKPSTPKRAEQTPVAGPFLAVTLESGECHFPLREVREMRARLGRDEIVLRFEEQSGVPVLVARLGKVALCLGGES
jgi:hypothetical protein